MTQARKMIPTKELRPDEERLYNLKKEALEKLDTTKNRYFNALGAFSEYEHSLFRTLLRGKPKFDRTGTGTIGIHGYQSHFYLERGFPLITTKKVHIESVIHELLWLVSGSTNIKYMVDNDVKIWDDWPFKNWWQSTYPQKVFPQKDSAEWKDMKMKNSLAEFRTKIKTDSEFAKIWGELGPVYGKQWRSWTTSDDSKPIDQLQQVVDSINKQHETGTISRRMLVSAWNASDIPAMLKSGLPPCHCLFQFHSQILTLRARKNYAWEKQGGDWKDFENLTDDQLDMMNIPVYQLDLQLYQRSCDIFLGVPFNIASYALLLMMLAQVTNCIPGTFIHDYGDLHVYSNHLDQVVTQLEREPRPYPTMWINPDVKNINDFKFEDFRLESYNPHSGIKASVAI